MPGIGPTISPRDKGQSLGSSRRARDRFRGDAQQFAIFAAIFVGSFGLGRWALTEKRASRKVSDAPSAAAPATPDAEMLAKSGRREKENSGGNPVEARAAALTGAFSTENPLVAARRMLDWITAATLEDFRFYAEHPDKFPQPKFSGFNDQIRGLFHEAFAKRWMELDPEGGFQGLQRIQKAHEEEMGSFRNRLMNVTARVMPQVVLDSLLKVPASLDSTMREAFTALAERDPATARKYLGQLSDVKSRARAEDAIAHGIAQGDPTAGVALAKQRKSSDLLETALLAAEARGPGALREAFAAAEGHLGATDVPRLILRYPDLAEFVKDMGDYTPGNTQSEATRHGAKFTTPEERAELLANYDKLPAALRNNLAAELASSWARTEPEAAANWALAHGQPNDGPARRILLPPRSSPAG